MYCWLKSFKACSKVVTSIKDNGGLIYLQEDVKKIFIIAEKQLSCCLSLKGALSDNFFIERNSAQIQKACLELIPNLSRYFDDHFSTVLKKLVNIYICVRCKFFSKDTNIEMKKNQTRQKMNKLVLFRHL